jgi:hypothetical protein
MLELLLPAITVLSYCFIFTPLKAQYEAGIATGYVLDGRGSILGRGKLYSVFHSVHTDSGTHPTSSSMDIGFFLPPVG